MSNVAPPQPSRDIAGRDEPPVAKAGDDIADEAFSINRYRGALGWLASTLLVAMALFHVYAAVAMMQATVLRPMHVGFTLVLVFLLFPMTRNFRHRLMWWDIVGALLGAATVAYLLAGGDAFWNRHATPSPSDAFFGVVFLLLVLEACRRTAGWTTVFAIGLILVYAAAGPWLPGRWQHPGFAVVDMTGTFYQTLDGVFGTAVKGSSSLIILFAIYGSFLRHAANGTPLPAGGVEGTCGGQAGAGRTVVLAHVLLGGAPGIGGAVTPSGGRTSYAMLQRAGYGPNAAGGLLAASGVGAIIAPPVLGATAFLVAEFLGIGYLDVLRMATIPALLYGLSLLLMVEIDARKSRAREGRVTIRIAPGRFARQYGFVAASLIALVALMLLDCTAAVAVLVATMLTFVLSFLSRDMALGPRKLWATLKAGSGGVLHVAATCAALGIIVGVVAKTGLGLKFSAMVVSVAGGSLPLTALFAALFVWTLGLALPLIASFVIGVIIIAPALPMVGVPTFAAHMFIFYYAVLAVVSPPAGALSVAAAAITGGDRYRTAMQSCKYALPAFALPFAFVLDPAGVALLLAVPPDASWEHVAWRSLTAVAAIAVLAGGMQSRLLRACTPLERWLLIACGLMLVYPSAWLDVAGLGGVFVLLTWQRRGMRRSAGRRD